MIEVQVINRILATRSMTLATQHGFTLGHFIQYRDEWEFIVSHYTKYGVVPDRETLLNKYQDFPVVEVHETDQYLVETLHEQYVYSLSVPVVHKIAELLKVDAGKAVAFMRSESEKMSRMMAFKPGTNIVQTAEDRLKELRQRNEAEGLLGITSGLKEIDKSTHGWMGEDLIVIVGRTNEGKTWVMLFFLVMAWLAGKRVLLYSGEMSKTIVGFRFDTLYGNFKNTALMSGENELGDNEAPRSIKDYEAYVNKLKTMECPFIVVTPKDIGGRRLTAPILQNLIEMHNPDIVGVDQISLMDDARTERGDQRRIQLTHIAEDLYLTSEKYGIPIMTPAQANRDAAKSDEDAPELDQIMDSDGIAQNATRVLAIKQLGSTMKIVKRKDRYGKKNVEFMLVWDIDRGVVKPFLTVQNNTAQPTEILQGEELF